MSSPEPTPAAPTPWIPVLGALVFALAYTQPALYYSNQNQYFLHGLAAAGYGDLRTDWLANTADPTPAFSLGVAWAYRTLGEWSFHSAFLILAFVYFLSLWGLATALPFAPRTRGGRLGLAALLIVSHAGIVRAGSVALTGVDYPWYLQAGVANQYLLGAGLQPSVFGVLLLTALAAFAHGRPAVAGLLAAAACAAHSTYLLPAALLVAGMVTGLLVRDQRRAALACGGSALVAVAPVVAFVMTAFAPTDAASFAEAQQLLAWVRIPHHTDVDRWLDPIAGLQIAWAIVGLILFRRTPLFVPLLVAMSLAAALTLIQVATGNATLALLFPWRVSAVLVPAATAAAAAGLARVPEKSAPRLLGLAGVLAALGALAGAAAVDHYGLGYQVSAAEERLQGYVSQTRQPGELYLLPAGFPEATTGRGSASSSFVPVPPTGGPSIFELQRFRLGTGAAVYVDFKSVPYRDDEVREWYRRVQDSERWYASTDWDESGVLDEVLAAGVTHVVAPADRPVNSERLTEEYADSAYRVYRITPGQTRTR